MTKNPIPTLGILLTGGTFIWRITTSTPHINLFVPLYNQPTLLPAKHIPLLKVKQIPGTVHTIPYSSGNKVGSRIPEPPPTRHFGHQLDTPLDSICTSLCPVVYYFCKACFLVNLLQLKTRTAPYICSPHQIDEYGSWYPKVVFGTSYISYLPYIIIT